MYTNPRILYNSQDPKNTKSCFQLQKDRSSRLFGVRSWDWYHVKAHTLYFHIKKKHFSFSTNFRSSILTKTKRLWIRFRINFTVWSPFEMRMFAIFPRFIARMRHIPYVKLGRPQYVPGAHSLWIWGPNSRLNETTTIKNNSTWN